jgi:hypothetical protein
MNFTEGMRRLGILLGVTGGIIGGLLSFATDFGNAPGVWNTLTAHRKFEAAMMLPTVQKAVKDVAVHHPNPLDALPPPAASPPAKGNSGEFIPPPLSTERSAPWDVVSNEYQDGSFAIFQASPLLKGNGDRIRSIRFDSENRVIAIEFMPPRNRFGSEPAFSEWVSRTAAPEFSVYLMLLAFPAFGFLLPWGTIRVICWVGNGFSTPKSG